MADAETTGPDVERGAVVAIASRRFRHDADVVVIHASHGVLGSVRETVHVREASCDVVPVRR